MERKSSQNLEDWLISKKNEREIIFMKKRMLSSSPTGAELKEGHDDNLKILSKFLQKPNSVECENALKRLKELFAKYPDSVSTKFVKMPNALQNLIGVFSNLSVAPKVHLLAAECLTNLSFSNDSVVAERLINASGAYLTQFLNSNNQNLTVICLWILGNLLNSSSKNVWKYLSAQNIEEQLLVLVNVSNEFSIREASLFDLLNLINRDKNKALNEKLCQNGEFLKQLFINLKGENNVEESNIQLYSCWILFYLSFLDDFKVDLSHVAILIKQIEIACSSNEWRMGLIFPSIRVLALLFSRSFCIEAAGKAYTSDLINVCIKLLQSEHVPLRKEALWLLTNLVTCVTHISSPLVNCLTVQVLKVVQISISDEILYLALSFLYNCVVCKHLSQEDCKCALELIVGSSQPFLKKFDGLCHELDLLLI